MRVLSYDCTPLSFPSASCILNVAYDGAIPWSRDVHLPGQYFQPRSSIRLFSSYAPSHECSRPSGLSASVLHEHTLHQVCVHPGRGHDTVFD